MTMHAINIIHSIRLGLPDPIYDIIVTFDLYLVQSITTKPTQFEIWHITVPSVPLVKTSAI